MEFGQQVTASRKKVKVVVVGAGVAGLTAISKLIHNGLNKDDVVVLEAQDYIGGRVKAQMCGNDLLDMGAMFIHGRYGNPVYEIVKTVGTIIEDGHDEDLVNRPDFFYASNGQKVPLHEVDGLMDHIARRMKEMDVSFEEDQSEGEIMTGIYHEYLENHNGPIDQHKREIYDAVFKWYSFFEIIGDAADSLDDVSALAGDEYQTFKGNLYTRMKGGYSTFINTMTSLIPEGVIRLNTPVANIDWEKSNAKNVLVTCENGDVFSTDHVIVTISLACLKSNHSSMFQPALPSPLLRTLDKMKCEPVGKIFLQWDEPFGNNTDIYGYEFLFLKSYSVTLKSDKSKRKTRRGNYWWEDLPGCETMSEYANVLLFWLLPHQVEITKDLDDDEVTAVLLELLQTFLTDREIPKPTAMYRTNWESNPYIQGGYSHPIPSFQYGDEKSLSQSFPSSEDPMLLFAGEGYTVNYMTTVHGAFITGETQAKKVLKANGISKTVSVVDIACGRHSARI